MSFLIKPCSFLFIILFTFFLKRAGIFKKEWTLNVLKVIMNCTLPAVVITAFDGYQRDFSFMILILIGLVAALGPYLFMYVLTKRMNKTDRVYYIISVSGFNIGCYGMPIINAFYGPIGTIACIMFDIGNSVMMTSGNYAFTSVLLKTDGDDVKVRFRDLLKRFFSSVPIDIYLLMLVLTICGVTIPHPLVEFISPLAAANPFLAMFMLGLLFTPPRRKSDWKSTLQIVGFRLGIMSIFAAILFRILPFSLEVRQILVLVLLCPIGAMAPAFIEKCHGDGQLAAFTNSISTITSLILMTVLTGIFGAI